jgi:hypothetical protein
MNSKRCMTMCIVFAAIALVVPQWAPAQTGVDNATATGVFQMEGDAQDTGNICFLTPANGGPLIATPVAPTTNQTDANGCPTVDGSGANKTWNLVAYPAVLDDWSSFQYANNPPRFTNKAHALFTPAFVADPQNSQTDNTFLGAAAKDTQDISEWNWNPHGVQDKADIFHAFAGAYTLNNGHTAIIAGMDRFGNSGDTTAGFWFVQDSTFALCTGPNQAASPSGPVTNTACTAAGTFVGQHFDGDMLIVSDFTTGGKVSTINVFLWQGGSLVLSESRSPAPCDIVNDNSELCGVVNNQVRQVLQQKGQQTLRVLEAVTTTTGGWTFTDKNGQTAYRTGEFLEIGVDLQAIFGANVPCFSNFFAETRSSTSDDASLSDLTTPVSFPLCSISASKQCTGSSIINGSTVRYNFTGSVINDGASTIYNPTVYDTLPTGGSNLNLTQPVGPVTSGNSATFSGYFDANGILGSGAKNLVSVAASSNSSGTPLNVVCGANPPTAGDNCADWGDPTAGSCPPTITTGLQITKICQTCLEGGTNVHVKVGEAFKVCNTSNVNVTGITIRDCRGTISGLPGSQVCSTGSFTTIASGVNLNAATNATTPTCADFFTTYTPTTAAASYSDQVIAEGTAALGQGTVYANGGAPYSASCDVCPVNLTCPTSSTLTAPCPTGLTCPAPPATP